MRGRGLPYYEEPEYHQFLLSRERREMFPPEVILSPLRWEGIENLLDFGMGNGYFLTHFFKYLPSEARVWGAECQELLIDHTLQLKVREHLTRFTPFYIERTEHPLLPDWIPSMDLIFCSCVLSTFADPALALRGIERTLQEGGSIVIIDWEKKESPAGPAINEKVSKDRMRFFIEDAGFKIVRDLQISPYVYGMEVITGENYQESNSTPRYADF